ncbi:tripartite tricarboxylate transporter substrate binding protein [Ramlibacter sp. WS9]|uniref:Bug family tripartite tricarboxylate transporter substrate binding protein n=1 Tax=Ramlibacter sp. WS9 TaxID=1882741 RepID=UPI00130514EC|nr:tripartite tricarboxylate transporter substrate binding protein [Ramlibacter sp. WS9]
MAAAAAALACAMAPALAQDFKGKAITVVVAAPPGTATDVAARIVTEGMRAKLGATFVIDNRPGAGGIIAVNQFKGGPTDGTRLLFTQGSTVVISPLTYKEARFNFESDFETIAIVAETPMLMVTRPAGGPASLAAAVASAKSAPDSISIGNPGVNSIPHLAGELLGYATGSQFRQVPMGTAAQGIQAVALGDIDIFVDGVASMLPMVAGGRLKALAVTASKELPGLEGIALAKDTAPGLVVSGWFGLFAPGGAPAALTSELNAAVASALQNPDVIAKLRKLGTYPTPGSVIEAKAFVKAEKAKWADVIRKSGIKPQ